MQKHVPNALTVLRLMLAGVFFILISGYRYPDGPVAVLWVAISVFIVAAITDVLDGHLARKWRVETKFGRIMDPFCDKVLIIGALIFLCGPRFVDLSVTETGRDFPFNMLPGNNVTGIYPWMVTLMLARELLVTDIRGELESQGMQSGARLSGKLKMLLQSVTIPAVIGVCWTLVSQGVPCEELRCYLSSSGSSRWTPTGTTGSSGRGTCWCSRC